MEDTNTKKLLKNRLVLEEIARHQWLESEKAGYDIGFDRAAEDWINQFAAAWVQYHMPKQKAPVQSKVASKKTTKSKRRSTQSSKSATK